MKQSDTIYKTRDEIVADVLASWEARIPSIITTEDSVVRILTEIFAEVTEQLFLQAQLTHDDIFIQTANSLALQRYGEEYGRSQKLGTLSTGTVRFDGAGGTFIPSGTQIGAPRASLDDMLIFETTEDATIPNPGVPTAPVASEGGAGDLPAGTYEYVVTFLTDDGETLPSIPSNALAIDGGGFALTQIDLADIPLGGSGTTGRNLYRRVDGGEWAFLAVIADNVTTDYVDDIDTSDGTPPSTSTAERITVDAQSTDVGLEYNANIGTITDLVGDPSNGIIAGVASVVNLVSFTGASDPEDTETFRAKLLEWVRTPKSGAPDDLVVWATSVDGCESASVTKNVNPDGDPELGSVVVRISGPGGIIPSGDVVAAVLAELESHDLANITIYVATYEEDNIDVNVQITPVDPYTVDDLTSSVQVGVAAYINDLPPGATVYAAGILAAVFRLPFIANVTTTFSDTTVTTDQKAVAGAIGVTSI